MGNKNNRLRMRVSFENIPIMDEKKNVRDEDDFDEMIGSLKLKLFGK